MPSAPPVLSPLAASIHGRGHPAGRAPVSPTPVARRINSAQLAAQRDWQRATELERRGELAPAAGLLERACSADPGTALYWLNLANVQRKLKREAQALETARCAFDLDRSCLVACHLLVELLRLHNRRAEALAVLRQLDESTEPNVDHRWLEGDLLFSMNRHQEATQALLQVLTMRPGHADAYMMLGFSLAGLKQWGSAAECFRTVTQLDPTQQGAAIFAVHYAAWACDWPQGRQDQDRMAQSMALHQDQEMAPPTSPFCLVAIDDDVQLQRWVAERESRRLLRDLGRRYSPPTDAASLDCHSPARLRLQGGRCRIGFVACDFRNHATSILMARLVELLDRQRFEVMLYSHGESDASQLGQRMAGAADEFVDCRHMSPLEQADRIREDGVALLIDLGGYTLNSRLQMFALRPAPVQASWLAFPGTTGADYIDYLIGDPVVTPLADAENFSEQIAQMPVCYQANDALRPHPETHLTRRLAGLPDEGVVFACFNQSYKFSDEMFGSWCRILHKVPGSVMWLLVPQLEVQDRLRSEAEHRGINGARLCFAPFVTQTEHLARLPLADIALDTFPCGAHTTCSDALWMGVPLITRVGRSFASRVAASLLTAVGLAQLAVSDLADYERLTVALAHDRDALMAIREHLRDNRRDLPLFDSAAFAADFGDLAQRMVDRWQQGLPPQALPAG